MSTESDTLLHRYAQRLMRHAPLVIEYSDLYQAGAREMRERLGEKEGAVGSVTNSLKSPVRNLSCAGHVGF